MGATIFGENFNNGNNWREIIIVHEDKTIEIGGKVLHNGSRVIIDDVLLWSRNLPEILLMFKCI